MNDDISTMAHPLRIRKMATRRGFSITHRAFKSYGEINRGLWWFDDQEFKLVSPEKELNIKEAIWWLQQFPSIIWEVAEIITG